MCMCNWIAVSGIMASSPGSSSPSHRTGVNPYQKLFADLKEKFPEFPDELVGSLIEQHHGNRQTVIEVLRNISNEMLYGGTSEPFQPDPQFVSTNQYPQSSTATDIQNYRASMGHSMSGSSSAHAQNFSNENYRLPFQRNVNDVMRLPSMNVQGNGQVIYDPHGNIQTHMYPRSPGQSMPRNNFGGQVPHTSSQQGYLSNRQPIGQVLPSRDVLNRMAMLNINQSSQRHPVYKQPVSPIPNQFGSPSRQQGEHISPQANITSSVEMPKPAQSMSNPVQSMPPGTRIYEHGDTGHQNLLIPSLTSPRPTFSNQRQNQTSESSGTVFDNRILNQTLDNIDYTQFGMVSTQSQHSSQKMLAPPQSTSPYELRKQSLDDSNLQQAQSPMNLSQSSSEPNYMHGYSGSLEQLNRSASFQDHLLQQKTSLNLLQHKIRTLSNDIRRIRSQLQQEEDEIIRNATVTKNPTENDILRLREEIQVLQKESLQMYNEQERIDENNRTSPVAAHPLRDLVQPRFPPPNEEPNWVVVPQHHGASSRLPHPHPSVAFPPHPHSSVAFQPPPSLTAGPQRTPPTPNSPPVQPFRNPVTPPSAGSVEIFPQFQPNQESHSESHSMSSGSSFGETEDQWRCQGCTFDNSILLKTCEICDTPRR